VEATAAGSGLKFICQPCPGLADAIEQDDKAAIEQLCRRFVTALMNQVPLQKSLDSLVLGCTHYPFAIETLQQLCGSGVNLIDNATPIARRTAGLVGAAHMAHVTRRESGVSLCTTGSVKALKEACSRWLPHLHQKAASQVPI
jgi:glutamate racemase